MAFNSLICKVNVVLVNKMRFSLHFSFLKEIKEIYVYPYKEIDHEEDIES